MRKGSRARGSDNLFLNFKCEIPCFGQKMYTTSICVSTVEIRGQVERAKARKCSLGVEVAPLGGTPRVTPSRG